MHYVYRHLVLLRSENAYLLTYSEAMGTVGEPTQLPCDPRLRAGKLAFLDRGSSVRT